MASNTAQHDASSLTFKLSDPSTQCVKVGLIERASLKNWTIRPNTKNRVWVAPKRFKKHEHVAKWKIKYPFILLLVLLLLFETQSIINHSKLQTCRLGLCENEQGPLGECFLMPISYCFACCLVPSKTNAFPILSLYTYIYIYIYSCVQICIHIYYIAGTYALTYCLLLYLARASAVIQSLALDAPW